MASLPALAPILLQYDEQAPVTAWPQRLVLTIGMVLIIGLAVWGMWRNWHKRIDRQSWVELPAMVVGFTADQVLEARYVATVTTEDWLNRIAAQGLGMPGSATVSVGAAGVLIAREGEQDIFLPTSVMQEVTSARGMAQEVYEREGLVAITWRIGDRRVTTGLRMAHPQEQLALIRAVSTMIGKAEV